MQQVRRSASQVLLEIMRRESQPMGARQARAALSEQAITMSIASVGRLLRDLDDAGLTTQVGAKGRVLSPEGHRQASLTASAEHTVRQLHQAIDVRVIRDVVDLLTARRAVEGAIARTAAAHARPDEIAHFDQLLREHDRCLSRGQAPQAPGLNFHRRLASLTQNRMLRAMADVVLSPRLDHVLDVLDIVLGEHHSEAMSIAEHRQIIERISAGDEDGAEQAMNRHLERMLKETQTYLTPDNEAIFQRLLSWAYARDVGGDPSHGIGTEPPAPTANRPPPAKVVRRNSSCKSQKRG